MIDNSNTIKSKRLVVKQVLDIDHHEAIVSHEVFDAVQAKLEMDKYAKERHPFPTLDVVDEGVLQGFVSVNRTCRGFTGSDYSNASRSVYKEESTVSEERTYEPDSHFNLDGFEIVRAQFFTIKDKPVMSIPNIDLWSLICGKRERSGQICLSIRKTCKQPFLKMRYCLSIQLSV